MTEETAANAVIDATHSEADFPTVIGPGGFWGDTGEDRGYALFFEDTNDSLEYISVGIELEEPSYIYMVYLQMQDMSNIKMFVTDLAVQGDKQSFDDLDDDKRCDDYDIDVDGSATKDCNRIGQHLTIRRYAEFNSIWFEKIVVLGTHLSDYNIEVTSSNYNSVCAELTGIGFELRLPGPTINEDEPQAYYPLTYTDYTFDYTLEFNS